MTHPLKVAMAAFAHPDAPTGYGIIGVKLHEYLSLAGAQILPGTEPGWDCIVAISLPAMWPFEGGRPRADIVWHSMFEVEPLPPTWAAPLNNCGLVWVPSQASADVFRAGGVTAPLMVSGYGVDPKLFYPANRSDHDGPYTFLVYGSALVGRKNVLRAIRAFIDAGLPTDEAKLIVKVAAGMSGSYVQDEHGRSVDCGISLSAGEGFGLQPLEQMATGLPVILFHNTGILEYANAYNSIPVAAAGKERSPEYENRFGDNGRVQYWQLVPDLTQTTDLIRWAFYNREAARKIGEQAAEDVHTNWTWAQAGERALKLLEQHYGG